MIGHFQRLEEVGKGSFANVYKGLHVVCYTVSFLLSFGLWYWKAQISKAGNRQLVVLSLREESTSCLLTRLAWKGDMIAVG